MAESGQSQLLAKLTEYIFLEKIYPATFH